MTLRVVPYSTLVLTGVQLCMVEVFKVVSKGSPLQRGCAETKPVIPRRKAKKEAKPEANVMDVECSVDYADDQASSDA